LAAGQRAVPVEQVERLLLGGGQALARGQRGVKHHGRGTELAPGREQRVQQLPPGRVAARALTAAGRALQSLILPLVFKFLVTDRSLAWRYDHHIDWGAPVTPAGELA